MPLPYPMQQFGRYRLGLAVTYKLLHERFGFDFAERYHHDLPHRIRTTMEIDHALFDAYGKIGLGYERPFPRASVEPFGHRFMPAMYGSPTGYSPDADPWGRARTLSAEEINALEPWTVERFERSEPVRVVLSQIAQLKKHYEPYRVPEKEFNPHYRAMSSLQNLGSVINTAFSIQGEELFLHYAAEPDLVHKLYANIAQLTHLCPRLLPPGRRLAAQGHLRGQLHGGHDIAPAIRGFQRASRPAPHAVCADDRGSVHDSPGLQRQRPVENYRDWKICTPLISAKIPISRSSLACFPARKSTAFCFPHGSGRTRWTKSVRSCSGSWDLASVFRPFLSPCWRSTPSLAGT